MKNPLENIQASAPRIARRSFLSAIAAGFSFFAIGGSTYAQTARMEFREWVAAFRTRAIARRISERTYARVMSDISPDTSVYALFRDQPEFNEQLWQYLNRRVSDWRIMTGKEKSKEFAPLLDRIERDHGVDRFMLLALWGVESSFGELVDNPKYMRPVIPALAALAWGEPRRRAYWEQELLNALIIVERGWSTPAEMLGSWAGAMGHTQWMPEVWLNVGLDYDGDGRVSPFGRPDDALASTARYLVQRGKYRRGEHWGYEVRLPDGYKAGEGSRSYAAWQKLGVVRADGRAFPQPNSTARFWIPVKNGPAFLLGPNFFAARTYNPSMNYTLAIVHLGDRIEGGGPFRRPLPGSERPLTLTEIQDLQRRLTALGFDTGGTDGRVGADTMRAVRAFQQKAGIAPADGYAGLKVLARLRQGS